MPLPSQTFSNIDMALRNYINTKIIPNGQRLIDGDALNNALNALCDFIIKYQVNGSLADISNTTGVKTLLKPVTIFTAIPSQVIVNNNVQNEYYLVNTTGFDIEFNSGFSYVDVYGDTKNAIPARSTIHITRAINSLWYLVSNVGGGTSGSADFPPQSGNAGKTLITNGNTIFWGATHLSIKGSDFINSTDYINEYLTNFTLSIFLSEANRYIYEDNGEWEQLPGGGFRINMAGFDSLQDNWHFEITLKPR